MAGIDDVTPQVNIEGTDEAVAAFTKLAEAGEEAFNRISTAAEHVGKASSGIDKMTKDGAAAFQNLALVGAEAFSKIIDAAASGDFGPLIGSVSKLGQALYETVEKAVAFVEAQASVMETMNSLAEATGMTLSQIEGLKDAFASVGVSTNGFERSIGRLAITIANEWSQIQQAVRTSADAQVGAMQHIEQTAFNVQKAYTAMGEALTNASRTAAHDAMAIQEGALGLQKAAQSLSDFAFNARGSALGVESAQLALIRARMNLAKDQGYGVSAADEKALKIEQDKLAVKEAELRLDEAKNKKAKEGMEMEELTLRLRKAKMEMADAETKQQEDAVKSMERIKQAHMDIEKSQLAAREAIEKGHEQDLKDIPKIAKELASVADGTKNWEQVMNHAEISAQNLTKAMILAASKGSGQTPEALDVFKEMVQLFTKMGDSADASQKKIEMVQHTMGAGFRAGQASAAQIVAVINRFGQDADGAQKALDKLFDSTEKFSKIKLGGFDLEESKKQLLEFNSSFARFETLLDQVKNRMAAIMAEPLTKMFDSMRKSLEDDDGALRKFAEGCAEALRWIVQLIEAAAKSETLSALGVLIVRLGSFIIDCVSAVASLIGGILRLIGLKGPTTFFEGLVYVIDLLKISLDGLRITLAGVLMMFGLVAAAADKAKSMLPGQQSKTWEQAKADSPILQAGKNMAADASADMKKDLAALDDAGKKLEEGAGLTAKAADSNQKAADKHGGAADKHTTAAESLKEAGSTVATNLGGAGDKLSAAAEALNGAAQNIASAAANMGKGVSGKAGGGRITGPGGPTDDRAGIFALSNEEHVITAEATAHYGHGLFEALNNLSVGGFAGGGMVGAGVRGATAPSGGLGGGPSSILNLTIDGHEFNGLRAPEHVASKLKTYAIGRQDSSAGKSPSWRR